MSIYAISDLHLSFESQKPMNKFGNLWQEYEEKMKFNWNSLVEKNDLVLIAGDVSWATYVKDARADFGFIDGLNGVKLISKGNHDYWWETITKLNDFLKENNFETVNFIHNTAYVYDNYVICAAKGYDFTVEEKYRERELIRLEISLEEGLKTGKEIIVMLHYPPFDEKGNLIERFNELFSKYNVKTCIYGHLHSYGHQRAVNGVINNVEFKLTSCDYLNFSPVIIRNT